MLNLQMCKKVYANKENLPKRKEVETKCTKQSERQKLSKDEFAFSTLTDFHWPAVCPSPMSDTIMAGTWKNMRRREREERRRRWERRKKKKEGGGEFFHRNFSLGFSNMKGFGAFVRIQLDPIIIRWNAVFDVFLCGKQTELMGRLLVRCKTSPMFG